MSPQTAGLVFVLAVAFFIAYAATRYVLGVLRDRREEREATRHIARTFGLEPKPGETDEELRERLRLPDDRLGPPPDVRDVVAETLDEHGHEGCAFRVDFSREDGVVRVILPLRVEPAVRAEVERRVRDLCHCGIWVDVV